MGSSRAAQEAEEISRAITQKQEAERKKRELENKLKSLDAQIAVLSSEFKTQKEELDRLASEDEIRNKALEDSRNKMERMRKADKS